MSCRLAGIAVMCAVLAPLLAACGSLGPVVADVVPPWAGGLPKDAPPRPGTPEYEEFRQRLTQPKPKEDSAEARSSAAANDAKAAPRR